VRLLVAPQPRQRQIIRPDQYSENS
jgi:hypothetical protein